MHSLRTMVIAAITLTVVMGVTSFGYPLFAASPDAALGGSVAPRTFVVCNGQNCDFQSLYRLIGNIVNFLLIDILSPVAIIAIMFAGFKYVTAQGNPGEIKKAHDIFYYVVIGMLIAFAAWLVVNTILTTLLADSDYNFLGNG